MIINNNLNPFNFKNYYIKGKPFAVFRNFCRRIKWCQQRIKYGISDYDVWDLDHYMTEVLCRGLRKLAKDGISYPGTDEFPDEASWNEFLERTANLIEYGDEESWENPYEPTNPDWIDFERTQREEREKALAIGLNNVAKHFKELWD